MTDPTAIRPAAAQSMLSAAPSGTSGTSTKCSRMNTIAATALTSSASTFLVALWRCIESITPMPRMAISSTPWAAPKYPPYTPASGDRRPHPPGTVLGQTAAGLRPGGHAC